jgi:hypothetical protein
VSEARAFLRLVRHRYQLARGFCGVPRPRALVRAFHDSLTEVLCDLITGHDLAREDAGGLACSYCQATPTRGAAF